MKACCAPPGDRRLFRRGSGALAWLAPVLALVLVPKCPLCLAAWFTLLTGVALPYAAASTLRVTLIAASVVALAVLATRRLRRAHSVLSRSRSPR